MFLHSRDWVNLKDKKCERRWADTLIHYDKKTIDVENILIIVISFFVKLCMIRMLISFMHPFLSQNFENNRLELFVDGWLFSDTIALKAAYGFLDRAYFFFRKDGAHTIVQICPKEDQRWSAETFALEYSDELLATSLRDRLEKENKEIRETIVKRALASYVDTPNFRSIDTGAQQSQNQINFDKDIDEILREIENDPDLKIDEEEISRILAEIEAETQEIQKQKVPKLDPNKLKDVKTKFQSR